MAALQQLVKLLRRGPNDPSSSPEKVVDNPKPSKRHRPKSRSQDSSGHEDSEQTERDKYWTMPAGMGRRASAPAPGGSRRLPPLPTGAPLLPDVSRDAHVAHTRILESPAHIYEEIPYWAVSDDPKGEPNEGSGTFSENLSNTLFVLTGQVSRLGDTSDVTVMRRHHSHEELIDGCSHVPPAGDNPNLCNDIHSDRFMGCDSSPTPSESHMTSAYKLRSTSKRLLGMLGNNRPPPKLTDASTRNTAPALINNTPELSITTPQDRTSQDLDDLNIPVHEETDFIGTSRDHIPSVDNSPEKTSTGKPKGHAHSDSVDTFYEYDMHERKNETESDNQRVLLPDNDLPFQTRDQGSFRSQDGSHGKSECSNETYSEYDLRSDSSSTLDYEGEYESILSKIRDNLKLKEDVLRLVSFSDGRSSTSSDTISLTTVSSLSQTSLTPDDQREAASTDSEQRHHQTKHKTGEPCDHASHSRKKKKSSKSSSSSSKRHSHHASSNQKTLRFDIDTDLSQSASKDDDKLSCRVTNFVPPETTPRRSGPRRMSGPVSGLRNNTRQNRLLADLMQKNHDRLSLVML